MTLSHIFSCLHWVVQIAKRCDSVWQPKSCVPTSVVVLNANFQRRQPGIKAMLPTPKMNLQEKALEKELILHETPPEESPTIHFKPFSV